jgi:hypothetical protein
MSDELLLYLRKLHEELSANPKLDSATIESLRVLSEDIRKVTQQGCEDEPSEEGVQNITSQLGKYVEQFEVQHPKLTNILSTLAERLADMGI